MRGAQTENLGFVATSFPGHGCPVALLLRAQPACVLSLLPPYHPPHPKHGFAISYPFSHLSCRLSHSGFLPVLLQLSPSAHKLTGACLGSHPLSLFLLLFFLSCSPLLPSLCLAPLPGKSPSHMHAY